MKVLIPGGHITCALAVADEFAKRDYEIVFVGRKREKGGISFEYKSVKESGYKHIPLEAGRLTRTLDLQSVRNALSIPVGFIRALFIVLKEKPDIIMSFGGYIALPLAFWGWLLGKKVYTHEQTMRPGVANELIAKFSRHIFISFEQTKSFFDARKVLYSGNPIRSELFQQFSQPTWFSAAGNKPLLLIMCGALGSHSINLHIESIAADLVQDFVVVHQTGNVSTYDDLKRLSQLSLTDYFVREHLSVSEMSYLYKHASIGVFRSGANTVYELLAMRVPSVLVPLPWSSHGEQQAQADYMEKSGVAKVFDQSKSSSQLLDLVHEVYENRSVMKEKFRDLSYQPDAAKVIVESITKI